MGSVLLVLCLVTPAFGVAVSLGWWAEEAPGSTHAYWEFTPGNVTAIPGAGYSARPEDVISPDPFSVVATIAPGGTYDGQTMFVGSYISVNLELPNYPNPNLYKEIWVDVGNNIVDPAGISLAATPTSTEFVFEILPGQGDAEFGVRIWPNPEVEKVGFMLFGTTAPAFLDYIHVDTICVPEPATLAILALGGLLLRKRIV